MVGAWEGRPPDGNGRDPSWRPLFFAKFFALVAAAPTTAAAMELLITPLWSPSSAPAFLNWSAHTWAADPLAGAPPVVLQWASSTNPPVSAPADFFAYG